jgi:hypothetical protein
MLRRARAAPGLTCEGQKPGLTLPEYLGLDMFAPAGGEDRLDGAEEKRTGAGRPAIPA